jgi:integrase
LGLVLSKIDSHYRPLFITLAYTGARPNEILALWWNDLDWNRKEISITKGLVRGFEGLPKMPSSERVLPMLPTVEAILTELERGALVSIDGTSAYIFLDKKGLPIRKHLDRIWARALKAAGLRHRPSYQLRHTFVSQCLLKGLSPGYVAKLLGHTTLETM